MKLETLVKAGFAAGLVGTAIGWVISIATTGAIVYVALHLVLKFW